MLTTAKYTCRQIAALLQKFNISHAVVSPGTRDTPIIMALNRSSIKCDVVIDERSAAFTALGMASISDSPVALVCTSGTAPLNFAPAIAEAYYRNIPLIVITADRPAAWIDQDDSQTIRQPGIFANYIKRQYSLPDNPSETDLKWMVNRSLNEGIAAAITSPTGPVHFNIEIGEPISAEIEIDHDEDVRQINYSSFAPDFPTAQSRELARSLADKKVLVVAGFNRPDYHLNRALSRLATLPNVAIVAEATANIKPTKGIVTAVDPTLLIANKESLRPDVVITLGGSIVSRNLKETLRHWAAKHWFVGDADHTIDCYMSLDRVFNIQPRYFLQRLAPSMQRYSTAKSTYRDLWLSTQQKALDLTNSFDAKWSDMLAVNMISRMTPRDYNLAVSNGMTLRHLLATGPDVHRLDCNRGVSGIDGSTSTAIGGSSVYNRPTLLLTGDMSAQYDMGALASPLISPRFKMVVINNGEGNIFRIIKTTRSLPELDNFMASSVNFPIADIGRAYGFTVLEASSPDSLKKSFKTLINCNDTPAILIVKTDARQSADEYIRYTRFMRENK